jgi:hypothetical protein
MKLLLEDKFHIYDFSDSIEKFNLDIINMDFNFIKNSIRQKANVILAYENPYNIDRSLIHPDKSLFIKSESPKFIFISARNRKKIAEMNHGKQLDYQEICQLFDL